MASEMRCPGATVGRNSSGTRKSTFRGSICSRFTIAVPASTNSPGLTLRKPALPSKGATRVRLSRRACARSTAASAVFIANSLSSNERCVPALLRRSSLARSKLLRARFCCASACCNSARSIELSSSTMTLPLVSIPPSVKLIDVTRPATSGRITTDSLEISVPTASRLVSASPTRTNCASTGTGPPGPPRAPPAAALVCAGTMTNCQ